MNIKATGKLDVRTLKTLQKAHKGAMYYIAIAVMCASIVTFIISLLALGVKESFKTGWELLACAGLLALLVFAAPRLSYNQLGRFKDAESEYRFGDESFIALTSKDGINQQAEYSYDMIDKVIETKEFIFIYQTKNTAFYVDKATVEGGTAEDIRAIFQPRLGKKYIIRK